MKMILVGSVLALMAVATAAEAQGSHAVRGYTRKDGTYVAPHMQTNPDSTRANNWSTQGNTNPYTGEEGTKPLYPSYTPSYRAPAPRTFGGVQPLQPLRPLEPLRPIQPLGEDGPE